GRVRKLYHRAAASRPETARAGPGAAGLRLVTRTLAYGENLAHRGRRPPNVSRRAPATVQETAGLRGGGGGGEPGPTPHRVAGDHAGPHSHGYRDAAGRWHQRHGV